MIDVKIVVSLKIVKQCIIKVYILLRVGYFGTILDPDSKKYPNPHILQNHS